MFIRQPRFARADDWAPGGTTLGRPLISLAPIVLNEMRLIVNSHLHFDHCGNRFRFLSSTRPTAA